MKKILLFLFAFTSVLANAQTEEEKLTTALKEFHQALVNKNTASINQQTDKALSYGHSNGFVETKADMIKNLETGFLVYHSFQEDSLKITMDESVANVRFTADIKAIMNNNDTNVHLKVLEVWVKKGKRWLLFARQAVR
ncbi:MAG TPA: nuclear transport factor 2 family protein [Chitinophagaceae bacterium]|jgi:hypothetical protein|nr:nuclear transport factor 2 family protein [Chitinophagaceae bacterium]